MASLRPEGIVSASTHFFVEHMEQKNWLQRSHSCKSRSLQGRSQWEQGTASAGAGESGDGPTLLLLPIKAPPPPPTPPVSPAVA